MASSIHIEKVSTGSFIHNDRSMKVSYLIDDSSMNECNRSADEAIRLFQQMKNTAEKNYIERVNQKMQKKTIFLKEAIVNLQEHHTLKDLEPIKQKLESYGYTVLQVSIHRDEGFVNDEQKKEKNYHAHITMFALNTEDGKSVKFGKNYRSVLSELQTFTAKTLGMKRGKISVESEAKKLNKKVEKATRRLDTHDYKRAMKEKEKATQELKLTVKELRAELEQYRKELVQKNKELQIFNKEDYQQLNKLKRELKKDNADEMLELFQKMKKENEKRVAENEALRAELVKKTKVAEDKKELIEARESTKALQTSIDTLKSDLNASRRNINDLSTKNEELKEENEALREENSTLKETLQRAKAVLIQIAKTIKMPKIETFEQIAEAVKAKFSSFKKEKEKPAEAEKSVYEKMAEEAEKEKKAGRITMEDLRKMTEIAKRKDNDQGLSL